MKQLKRLPEKKEGGEGYFQGNIFVSSEALKLLSFEGVQELVEDVQSYALTDAKGVKAFQRYKHLKSGRIICCQDILDYQITQKKYAKEYVASKAVFAIILQTQYPEQLPAITYLKDRIEINF